MKKLVKSTLKAWLVDPTFPNWKRWFLGCIFFSLFTHLICAYFSVGHHSADEYFQILEFLNYKLGGTPLQNLPVEFTEKMRPWMQPAIYWAMVQVLMKIGVSNPFHWAFCFRLFASIMGWISCVLLAVCIKVWFRDPRAKKFCLAAIAFLWFLPALHSRPSSESLGGSFFLIALSISVLFPIRTLPVMITGIFLGLSFESRFQMALMVVGWMAWILVFKRPKFKILLSLGIGLGGTVLLGRIVDAWGYGAWSWSPWNYFYYNLVRGEVSRFGNAPWWDLFRMSLTESWPPLGLLLAIAIVIAWIRNPKHILTWSQIPFFLVHEWISHKELRFFFPIAAAGPVLLTLAAYSPSRGKFFSWPKSRWPARLLKGLYALALADNAIALIALVFSPASRSVYFYEKLYHTVQSESSGSSRVLYGLNRDPFEVLGNSTYFYKPPGLQTEVITSLETFEKKLEQSSHPEWLFITKMDLPKEAERLEHACTPLFRTIPKWLALFNFSNIGAGGTWVDRVTVWTLYECDKNRLPSPNAVGGSS